MKIRMLTGPVEDSNEFVVAEGKTPDDYRRPYAINFLERVGGKMVYRTDRLLKDVEYDDLEPDQEEALIANGYAESVVS